jgi:hypothetical protein
VDVLEGAVAGGLVVFGLEGFGVVWVAQLGGFSGKLFGILEYAFWLFRDDGLLFGFQSGMPLSINLKLKGAVSSNIVSRVTMLPEGVVREIRRADPEYWLRL